MSFLVRQHRSLAKRASLLIYTRLSSSAAADVCKPDSSEHGTGNDKRRKQGAPSLSSSLEYQASAAITPRMVGGKFYQSASLTHSTEPETESPIGDAFAGIEERASTHLSASTSQPHVEEAIVSDMLVDSHGRRHNYWESLSLSVAT